MLTDKDIQQICEPYGVEFSAAPKSMQHIGLGNSKINTLVGEEAKRLTRYPFKAYISSDDQMGISSKEENIRDMWYQKLVDIATQKLQASMQGQQIDQKTMEEEMQKELSKFDKYLKETCNKTLDDWNYRLNGWLVSYGEGNSLNYHNHRGSQLSSVLYIIADSEDNGGDIIFTDPRQNANRGYDPLFNNWFEPFRFKPKCAEIVIFPSFLYHFVETYGSNVRLAMPVDLFLFKK
jgi:hypothetical protein